jgi:hypothetical protein
MLNFSIVEYIYFLVSTVMYPFARAQHRHDRHLSNEQSATVCEQKAATRTHILPRPIAPVTAANDKYSSALSLNGLKSNSSANCAEETHTQTDKS